MKRHRERDSGQRERERERDLKMSTRRGLFHFLNSSNWCVCNVRWGGTGNSFATAAKRIVISAHAIEAALLQRARRCMEKRAIVQKSRSVTDELLSRRFILPTMSGEK